MQSLVCKRCAIMRLRSQWEDCCLTPRNVLLFGSPTLFLNKCNLNLAYQSPTEMALCCENDVTRPSRERSCRRFRASHLSLLFSRISPDHLRDAALPCTGN